MRVMLVVKDWVDSNLKEVEFQDRASLQDGVFYPGAVLDGLLYLDNISEETLADHLRRGFYLVALVNDPKWP